MLTALRGLKCSSLATLRHVRRSMSGLTGKYDPKFTRSCAIIAHVDHGKTTMMDKLLGYCGTNVASERAMDSNEHEKERGITIMSKYTRLYFKNFFYFLYKWRKV
jgi:translation elongation factor EF-G